MILYLISTIINHCQCFLLQPPLPTIHPTRLQGLLMFYVLFLRLFSTLGEKLGMKLIKLKTNNDQQ